MHQIQLLLPLRDNEGKPFPANYFQHIRKELTEEYGGLTAYSRSPATGLWKNDENTIVKDTIVIFEVMTKKLDKNWWSNYKMTLQKRFAQEEIIIREQLIQLL